jgi:hypothetical protein
LWIHCCLPKQRNTVLNRDVKFEEDFVSRKSHEPILVIEDEEEEALKVEPRSPVISREIQQTSSEEGEKGAPSRLPLLLDGVDYEETFAPVTKYTSIRVVMSLVSFMGWRIHHMDVKTTFLNGIIEVYIEKPQGFELSGKESHVCKLKKAM